jgi:hypothetical protein
MIYYRKEKQFLGIYKNTKTNPEKKCIGIFDLKEGDWTKEAPFMRNQMSGQHYSELLKRFVYSFDNEVLLKRKLLSFVDFYFSIISKKNEENYLKDSRETEEIFWCIHRCVEYNIDIKDIQKTISKQIQEYSIREFRKKVADCNFLTKTAIYSKVKDKPLFRREYVEELCGYFNMMNKVRGNPQYSPDIFFEARYFPEVQRLLQKHFTQTEIFAYNRIKYFQGACLLIKDEQIENYLLTLRYLEKDIPTGNFLLNYRTIMLERKENEESLIDKQFKSQQKEFDLNFENEKFKIYTPISKSEVKYFGNYFHNCLAGLEWSNYLINNKRKVVIVINKLTNEPCVCCDIQTNSLEISQFLKTNNDLLTYGDKELKDFECEYQEYLFSLK